MTTRRGELDRLAIASPCTSSWDAMEGDGSRRHCAECRRSVLDFAQMTPRRIRAHLEASGGALCVRLTRRDGRLVVAEPAPPPGAVWTAVSRRVPPMAAGLVGAWLCLGTSEARAAEPGAATVIPSHPQPAPAPAQREALAPGAGLSGRVVTGDGDAVPGVHLVARNELDGDTQMTVTGADGTFRFAALPAGIYSLRGNRRGYRMDAEGSIMVQPGNEAHVELPAEVVVTNSTSITTGVLVSLAEPLRQRFATSELVVTAVAGRSVVVAREGDYVEVVTDLRLERSLKGTVPGRHVLYRHGEYLDADAIDRRGVDLRPGLRVLAFLRRSEPLEARGEPTFEAVDYAAGIRPLGDAAHDAYLARLEALLRLERDAAVRGELDPADLGEWLVATVEDPFTRDEATGELDRALYELREQAARAGASSEMIAGDLQALLERFHAEGGILRDEPLPLLVAAFLPGDHRERLAAALLATERLDQGDRALFAIVRSWEEELAVRWLARQLRRAPSPREEPVGSWWLGWLAEEMGNAALGALVEAAVEREQQVEERWRDDPSPEAERLRGEQLAAVARELRRDYARALTGSP